MLRRLTKLVTDNFGLKVLAAVFAVILWLVIINVEDPEKSTVFTVPVRIENADYLTEMGKTYEVLDDSDVISITVTGKRSIIEDLSATDFSVVANMENIDETMSMIPITISVPGYGNQLEISKRSSYVQVLVENLVTKEYDIEVVTNGTPSSNCYLDSTEVTPQKVTVTGPETYVNEIERAEVSMDISGAWADVSDTGQILLLDKDGAEVSQAQLTLSSTDASMVAHVLMKKEVPIEFNVTGELSGSYRLESVKSTVDSVVVEGTSDVLGTIEKINISAPQLNVDGATATFTAVIHLADYLPDGVTLAEGEKEDAEVTVAIQAQMTKTFEMPAANVTVNGLSDGLNLTFQEETLKVNITGFGDTLSEVNQQKLTGTLDASSLTAGTYTVAVKINGDYADVAEASAAVIIQEK